MKDKKRYWCDIPEIKDGDKFRVIVEEDRVIIRNGYSCVYIKKRFFSKKYYLLSFRVDALDIPDINKILREFNLKI